MKFFSLIFSLTCLLTNLFPQTFINFTKENSFLCNDTITSLAIDADGNKWIGTKNGLSEFDGTNWTTYSTKDGLESNSIGAITIDKNGNKWFGYSGSYIVNYGISKFNDLICTNYNQVKAVHSIVCDSQGDIWIGTSPNDDSIPIMGEVGPVVTNYDGNKWSTIYKHSDASYTIAVDSKNNKWVGSDGSPWMFKDDKFNAISNLPIGAVHAICVDVLGNIWFCSNSDKVLKYDGLNSTFYTTKDGLINGKVNSIACDKLGNIWFGTDGGISKYDGKKWESYTTTDGLTSNVVNFICIDSNDNAWIGTNGGLSLFKSTTTSVVNVNTAPSISLYPIPFKDKLNAFFAGQTQADVSIVDVTGKQVQSAKIGYGVTELDMSKQSAGVYFVKVITSNGAFDTTQIIKQ